MIIDEEESGMRVRVSSHSHQSHSHAGSEEFEANTKNIVNTKKEQNIVNISDVVTSSTTTNNNFSFSLFKCLEFPDQLSFLSVTLAMRPQFMKSFVNAVLNFAGTTAAIIIVGNNFDTLTLAANGICITLSNLLGNAFLVGFASALDSLISQAIGRKDYVEVADMTFLGIFLCMILCIPFSFLFLKPSFFIVTLFGAQYEALVTPYLLYSIPYLFLGAILACLGKSLQSSHRAHIPMKATMVSSVTTVLSAIYLIPKFGLKGAACCNSINALTQILAMIFFMWREVNNHDQEHHRDDEEIQEDDGTSAITEKQEEQQQEQEEESQTNEVDTNIENDDDEDHHLPPQSIESLRIMLQVPQFHRFLTKKKISEFCWLGAASTIGVVSEWLVFECLLIVAARLGPTPLAAFEVFFSIIVIMFAFPASLGVASSSWVGKLLGANKPAQAFTYGRVAMTWALILPVMSVSTVIIFHETIFSFYTKNQDVIVHLKNILGVLALFVTADCVQFTINSIFRGASKQHETASIVLASLWCVGLPLAIYGSRVADLQGLIGGFALALLLEVILLSYRLISWDWIELAKQISFKEHHHDNVNNIDNNINSNNENENGEEVELQEESVIDEKSSMVR